VIRRAKRLARWLLRVAGTAILLGAIFWAVDGAGLWSRLASADLRWFSLAILLGILANVVSAWRWLIIARHLNLTASARALLPAYGKGVTLNTLLPGATLGGDAYRALVLQKLGNPMLKAAGSVALDRLSGLWALFVLSLCAWLALLLDATPMVGRTSSWLHLGMLLLAVATPFFAGALLHALPLAPHRLPARLLQLLAETARFARFTFVSSCAVQIATIGALACALKAVTPVVPMLYLCAIAAPVFFITALPVSLGGFGTREAALAAYWALAGLPAEAAIAGALLHGLAVSLQGVLWAPLFLLDHHAKPVA